MKERQRFSTVILLVVSSLALSACGGGDGGGNDSNASGGPAPATKNLIVTNLAIQTPNPQIGFPLKVSTTLSANEGADNVGVSMFAIEKTADPAIEGRQFPLGAETIPHLDPGVSVHEFEVNVPSSVQTAGSYYLVAVVDAAAEIEETDEDDNTYSVEAMVTLPLVPNVYIQNVELDRTAMEIDTSSYQEQVNGTPGNVHNADAGGTLTVGADGLDIAATIDIEAFANLRMTRSDTGTTHDVPLYLWNSDAKRYMNAYGVDPTGTTSGGQAEWLPLGQFHPQLVETAGEGVTLNDVDRNSTHLNFYFPGKLGSELEYEMRYGHLPVPLSPSLPTIPPPDLPASAISALKSFLRNLPSNGISGDESDAMAVMSFAICVDIRPVANTIVDSDVSDNRNCSPLQITLPPLMPTLMPTPPTIPSLGGYTPQFSKASVAQSAGKGFSTKGGGSAFAFGVSFGNVATADYRGYKERVYGSVPVTIFGVQWDFMKIDVNAQLVPDYPGKAAEDKSDFTIEIRHAGQLLTSIYKIPANTEISLALDKLSFSKELPDPKKGGIAESTIFVGPIPLSAGAYVSGNVGVEFKPFVFTSNSVDGYQLGIAGGPFANLEGVMYAGIGSRRLPVIVGVEGVLTLLDERIELFNGIEIDEINEQSNSTPEEFIIRQGPKLSNIFTGPQGKLNLFAEYTVPKIKTCKVGLIKFPCPGFVKLKATKLLWKSPKLFKLEDVLWEAQNMKLDVVIPQGQPPLYFTE